MIERGILEAIQIATKQVNKAVEKGDLRGNK